ncbi:MAG: toprim domain-containing protein, partial [Colwellia sp.]
QEIYYFSQSRKQSYFGLAWGNDKNGGYEVRNKLFKGFIGDNKGITTFNPQKGGEIAVFEGMLDFLSFLTHYKINNFQSTAIIANSSNTKNDVVIKINELNPSRVFSFHDNDSVGLEFYQYLTENILNCPIIDKSKIYVGFKDYNEFLKSK